jgi:hypothetical protein
MAKPKYPLDPLLDLREKRKDEAGAALAGAVAARTQAEEAATRAAGARQSAEQTAAVTRSREAKALEDGALTAADLQRAGAWEQRVESERLALMKKEEEARAAEAAAREQEAGARGELAARDADVEVVAKDRARHLERLRREAEAKAEEEASEAWRKR